MRALAAFFIVLPVLPPFVVSTAMMDGSTHCGRGGGWGPAGERNLRAALTTFANLSHDNILFVPIARATAAYTCPSNRADELLSSRMFETPAGPFADVFCDYADDLRYSPAKDRWIVWDIIGHGFTTASWVRPGQSWFTLVIAQHFVAQRCESDGVRVDVMAHPGLVDDEFLRGVEFVGCGAAWLEGDALAAPIRRYSFADAAWR